MNDDEGQINICLASDNRYAPYMGISILSILKSSSNLDKLSFFILDNGISDIEKQNIEDLKKVKDFKIAWIKIDDSVFDRYKIHDNSHYSKAIFFRLLIPKLVDEDKVLYLDSDVLVRDSLSKIFNTDITGYAVAGVNDICVRVRGYCEKYLGNKVDSNYYINSGVLLINNKYWKQNDVYEKLTQYLEKEDKTFKYPDQDAINVVLSGKIKLLDPRWNVINATYNKEMYLHDKDYDKYELACKKPGIRHFRGWEKNSLLPFRSEYLSLMGQSPWKDRIEKDDPKFIIYVKAFFIYMIRHPFCFLLPRFYKRWYHRGFVGVIRNYK